MPDSTLVMQARRFGMPSISTRQSWQTPMPQNRPRSPPFRVRRKATMPAAVNAAATVSPLRASIRLPAKSKSRRSAPSGAKLARMSGASPAKSEKRHQLAIAPADALVPLVERQGGTPFGDDGVDGFVSPALTLAALGAHADIGGKHASRMSGNAAAGIEIERLEGTDDGPAEAQSFAHQKVDVGGGGDAFGDQRIGLAEQSALQSVEDEPLLLEAQSDR